MRKASDHLNLAYDMFSEAARKGLMYHTAEDEVLNGRSVRVNGKEWINFASCSYLGLELDERLKQGAIDAVQRYGTQFSSSRSMLSAPPYAQLEELLEGIFGMPPLVTPTTSLGHIAALPILIEEDDVVLLDQQVHHSVQTATKLLRSQGMRIELIRHNRLDMLEEAIVSLRPKYRRIWYMADGLYSMYGDFVPWEGIRALLDRYEQLHVYVDDAHAMSWTGTHGRGYALERSQRHERVVVATSLNKAFGVSGAALIIPDGAARRKIRAVGGPMVFSGPIQPANLGAMIASARLHLSDEIRHLQAGLVERIRLCNQLLTDANLPLFDQSIAPIRFIGLGLPRVAYNMADRLLSEGLFVNVALFPAVPMKRSGIRFTLTRHHTPDDIRRFVEAFAYHLPRALEEEGSSLERIQHSFDLQPASQPIPTRTLPPSGLELTVTAAEPPRLRLQHETTITALDEAEWDRLLGDRGSFTWQGLRFLEATFAGNPRAEDNWKFHYFLVRDSQGAPLLATFFTEALWKDDMIAPPAVSRTIEERRSSDPYYLTSRTLAMGSLLTEGDHLFLDRARDWKSAMRMLLQTVGDLQEAAQTSSIVLRDLDASDRDLAEFLHDEGYARFLMPESLVLDTTAQTEQELWDRLSRRSRKHLQREVFPWDGAYEIEYLTHGGRMPSQEEFEHFNRLYEAVKAGSLDLNTFTLPPQLFETMLRHPGWELMTMTLKPEFGGAPGDLPLGVSASYVGQGHFVPLVIGLDYRYVHTHGLYRQFLLQVIRRARLHGARRLYFGMGARLEKERFGAVVEPRCLYVQSSDHYHQEVLGQLMGAAG